jgi:hypothetical protein
MSSTESQQTIVQEETFFDKAKHGLSHMLDDVSKTFKETGDIIVRDLTGVYQDVSKGMTTFSKNLGDQILEIKEAYLEDAPQEVEIEHGTRSHIDSVQRPAKIEGMEPKVMMERKEFLSKFVQNRPVNRFGVGMREEALGNIKEATKEDNA